MPNDEPRLDARDIQGNILPGFSRAEQWLVGFSGADPASLEAALRAIAGRLTPLADALDHRDARKQVFLKRMVAVPATGLWLNYALGRRAAEALGLTDPADADVAFSAGMAPGRTGDSKCATLPDGSPNPAAPVNWVVGGPNRPLDLLLIFAADADVETQAAAVVAEVAGCGLTQIYAELGLVLPGHKEHFGFQDGISNPGVAGLIEIDGTQRYLTTRYGVPDQNGVAFGKPGEPLQDPSQFLLDVGPARNGAFLVFRRLLQDVPAFYDDTQGLAQQITAAGGSPVSPDELRAKIVGRWPSGQPLMRAAAEVGRPESDLALNYFAFANPVPDLVLTTGEKIAGAEGDPQALQGGICPAWAHIRKVNPRDVPTNKGGADETRGFQMLRRGIPFGPAYDHANAANPDNARPRGLLFLAYQSAISTQFEELNSDWMNSQVNPIPGGFDLLVGQQLTPGGENGPKPAHWFDAAAAKTTRISAPRQWVLPTGGAYLFAPSISWTLAAAQLPVS